MRCEKSLHARSQPSLLEEAAELFALSGGWRMPGAKLDLEKIQWLCKASGLAPRRAARQGGQEDVLPEMQKED
jgi:hypothetical protein